MIDARARFAAPTKPSPEGRQAKQTSSIFHLNKEISYEHQPYVI